jgi:hypothetical protein
MLALHTLAWIACAPSLALAQPEGPAPLYRLPVHVVDCAASPAGRSPVAVVGTLFTGGNCFREYDADRLALTPPDQLVLPCPCKPNKFSPAMTEYLLGNVRPRPSAKDEDTCAFLTSPPLSNGFDGGVGVGGFDFTIDSLTLQGSTYTATTTFWHDDSKHQWGPGPLRTAHMLRLSSPGYGPGGWLRPGSYTFTIISRDLFMSVTPDARPLYHLVSTRNASTAFSVVDADPWNAHTWDQAPSTSIIRDADLNPTTLDKAAVTPSWPRWQPPVFAVRRADGKNVRPENAPILKDASREVRCTFSSQTPGSWKNYAPPAQPLWDADADDAASALDATKGIIIARVAGIEWAHRVAPSDTVELTSVEWTATDAVTLHIALWHRSAADERPQIPELAIPLETRGLPGSLKDIADRLKITLSWDEL